MSKKKIIFVDDDESGCKFYLAALRPVFEVIFCEGALDGLDAIKRTPDASLIILDIMMPLPPGVPPSSAIQTFRDTGLWLLDEIKSHLVHRPLPVFVLTNRSDNTLVTSIASVNEFVRTHSGRTKDQIDYRTKTACQAAQLVPCVEAMIGRFI